ncbi:30S ribosomal protein S20 [Patescibacteria group bacterium]|nr:30S ribosomal protein S20 [Patescibacteria group bacterium]
MPILKQSKKRVKQTKVKQARNYNVRTALKKAIRGVNDAVKSGNKSEAEKMLSVAYKKIDTAVKKNIMKKNTGARRKSVLAKKIAGLSA